MCPATLSSFDTGEEIEEEEQEDEVEEEEEELFQLERMPTSSYSSSSPADRCCCGDTTRELISLPSGGEFLTCWEKRTEPFNATG